MINLPHWCITDDNPAFYDLESKTALEQTARVYAAMRNLIDDYNGFVDKINTEIKNFEDGSRTDFDVFTKDLRQEFQDFIDVINLKYSNQNNILNNAVDYMKTNLSSSISALLEEYRENGSLTNDILFAFNDLVTKINALNKRVSTFESLEEGSTTGDAELIDIRNSYDGITYDNAGDCVRAQGNDFNNRLLSQEYVLPTSTAQSHEKKAAKNFMFVDVYPDSLLNVKVATIYNDSDFPRRIILKRPEGGHDIILDFAADSDICSITTYKGERITIAYNWGKHTENVNLTYAESQLTLSPKCFSNKLNAEHLYNLIAAQYSSEYVELSNELEVYEVKEESYISAGGGISSLPGYDSFKVLIYKLEANKTYGITGTASLADSFPIISLENNTILATATTAKQEYNLKITPYSDTSIRIATYEDNNNLSIGLCKTNNEIFDEKLHELDSFKNLNHWKDKKVVWIGTSVSFGQYASKSYPHEVSKMLGFNLVNCSTPGIGLHTNSDGSKLTYGSLVLSKSEYQTQGQTIPENPIEYTPGGGYNDYYRTYENIFTAENADADLFVFDVAPNNSAWGLTDWNAFDFNNWTYTDGSTFEEHRTTFLGALLFLMDKMYELNPNARMVFVLGSSFAYDAGKAAFNTVNSKWKIPCIDLWEKINISPKSLTKLKSRNGTDPHPSTFAHECMGKMLVGELLRIG